MNDCLKLMYELIGLAYVHCLHWICPTYDITIGVERTKWYNQMALTKKRRLIFQLQLMREHEREETLSV
jgi:hypothetical protein